MIFFDILGWNSSGDEPGTGSSRNLFPVDSNASRGWPAPESDFEEFSLDRRFSASGMIEINRFPTGCEIHLGFYRSHAGRWNRRHFVGACLAAYVQTGRFFMPAYRTPMREKRLDPLSSPWFNESGTALNFSMEYDPAPANGNGLLAVSLGVQMARIALAPGSQVDGSLFNRFGLVSLTSECRIELAQVVCSVD